MDEQRRTPPDFPRLRAWIGDLVGSYDVMVRRGRIGYSQEEVGLYRDCLLSAALACDGEFKRPLKARIRELLALGAASYGLATGVPGPAPYAVVPRQVPLAGEAVVDFAVCALWPMVTVPELPKEWLGAFLNITRSTALAGQVVRARYVLGTPDAMNGREFGQALTQVNFAPGVRQLLHDLADPRRAGCALTAMTIAHTGYAPRRGATQKRVARWALAAATGGVLAQHAPIAGPRFVPRLAEPVATRS